MTRKYVDERGAVKNLTVRGGDGSSLGIAEAFLKGDLSFSTSQISQLSLTLRENGIAYPILSSGLFNPTNGLSGNVNDGALDLDDLRFTLASIGAAPDGRGVTLTAEARSHGGVRMTSNTDASTLTRIDPVEWVRRKAESLGLRVVAKASGQVWAQVGNQTKKDSWTTAGDIAKDLGYWCFEAAGTLYLGPPTWLVQQTPRRSYAWKVRAITEDYFEDPLLQMPSYRRVGDPDVGVSGTTVSLVLRDSENDLLPGMGLELSGTPGFAGVYIVTDVKVPLGAAGRIAVTAELPVDPVPTNTYVRSEALTNAPVAVGTGQSTKTPEPGKFAGSYLGAEQIGYAVTITQTAIDKRLIMPKAAVLAVACALQESTLRNLTGGDRDSVGLFQQRPSQGWGTVAQCRTPSYAAGKFYDTLVRSVPGYGAASTTKAMGDAIQKVQRSGFPRAYDKWFPEATALVTAILAGSTGTTTVSAAAASTPASAGGQVEAFVQKCLAQAGKQYIFGAEVRLADPSPGAFDCSELVEWAAYQVGVKIADGSQNQRRACKAFHQLSIAQAMATRGALLFTSGHVAVSLGDGRTIEAKGRLYGVVIDVVAKRFTDAGLIPGMSGYQVKG